MPSVTPPVMPPSPPAFAWREIGRAWPEEDGTPAWIAWMAPWGDCGDALYRCLVIADGSVSIAIEFQRHGGVGARSIYRGRWDLPPADEDGDIAPRIRLLLAAADAAAAKATEATRQREGADRADGVRWREEMGDGPERRIRERAYFLWLREGCPTGRDQEFWVQACLEEAREVEERRAVAGMAGLPAGGDPSFRAGIPGEARGTP
jgi:hypothetical protein